MGQEQSGFGFDMTERFPHLSGAPIVEAVLHWQARAKKTLQPDELQKELTTRLPDYPSCKNQRQLKLQFESQFGADGISSHSQSDSWIGFRLTSVDQCQIAQFNRDGLVFSRLQPYENWGEFSTEALRLWKIFVDLTGPSEIQRLGVRFINRIEPIRVSDVERYLKQPPKNISGLDLPSTGFLYKNTYGVTGTPFQISVVQTIQPSATSRTDDYGLILDSDVFTKEAFPCDDTILEDYLAKMRWLKNKVFFSLLSKEAISKLEGTKK